jgi:hypothetical protein
MRDEDANRKFTLVTPFVTNRVIAAGTIAESSRNLL